MKVIDQLRTCIFSPQRSTPSPVPQARESSSTLEKQMGAGTHGSGCSAAGSRSLALAPAGKGSLPCEDPEVLGGLSTSAAQRGPGLGRSELGCPALLISAGCVRPGPMPVLCAVASSSNRVPAGSAPPQRASSEASGRGPAT